MTTVALTACGSRGRMGSAVLSLRPSRAPVPGRSLALSARPGGASTGDRKRALGPGLDVLTKPEPLARHLCDRFREVGAFEVPPGRPPTDAQCIGDLRRAEQVEHEPRLPR